MSILVVKNWRKGREAIAKRDGFHDEGHDWTWTEDIKVISPLPRTTSPNPVHREKQQQQHATALQKKQWTSKSRHQLTRGSRFISEWISLEWYNLIDNKS